MISVAHFDAVLIACFARALIISHPLEIISLTHGWVLCFLLESSTSINCDTEMLTDCSISRTLSTESVNDMAYIHWFISIKQYFIDLIQLRCLFLGFCYCGWPCLQTFCSSHWWRGWEHKVGLGLKGCGCVWFTKHCATAIVDASLTSPLVVGRSLGMSPLHSISSMNSLAFQLHLNLDGIPLLMITSRYPYNVTWKLMAVTTILSSNLHAALTHRPISFLSWCWAGFFRWLSSGESPSAWC